MKRLLSAIAAILLISACTNKVSYLSVVVPENQYFDANALAKATVRKSTTGESWRPIILFFPIGYPNFETALNEALIVGRGNMMTNVSVVERTRWWVAFGYKVIKIHGDVVDVPRTARRPEKRRR